MPRICFVAGVPGAVLAGAPSPPDVSWSPYVWTVLALVAATVYVAFRMRARVSKPVYRAALAGLALATIGTTVLAYHAGNAPYDDESSFCSTPDPSPPTSVEADRILQECAAGTTVRLSRGQTVAIVLAAHYGVDTQSRWTDLSVSDGNVVTSLGGSPYMLPGPPNSQLQYEVARFKASQPGETTVTAVYRGCGIVGCDRGVRWWVTIQVS